MLNIALTNAFHRIENPYLGGVLMLVLDALHRILPCSCKHYALHSIALCAFEQLYISAVCQKVRLQRHQGTLMMLVACNA